MQLPSSPIKTRCQHGAWSAIAASLTLLSATSADAAAIPTGVIAHQKISDTVGGFTGTLDNNDIFGRSVTSVGDLDGDGINDIAVGAIGDADGGPFRGAVWILFLNTNGTVKSHQKISDTQGGFNGDLSNTSSFGSAVAGIGDLDGDGKVDLVVGAESGDDGGTQRGEVWVLFLNANGTVKAHQKISDTAGNFTGVLDDQDFFGGAVANLGDIDGDGVTDLGVGTAYDDDGGMNTGACWVLLLNANGTVKNHQKISATQGGLAGLSAFNIFGSSVAGIGDLNGDGVPDLAVGAQNDNDGGTGRGAVWVLFLDANGTVISSQKINEQNGGFTGSLDDFDNFGASLASLGALDGAGVGGLVVGAPRDDDGGPAPDPDKGAIYVLQLGCDGTVLATQKVSDTEGGFTGVLDGDGFNTHGDNFGKSVANLGDLNGDGHLDIVVGADFDDDGGATLITNRGAVWTLFLDTDPGGVWLDLGNALAGSTGLPNLKGQGVQLGGTPGTLSLTNANPSSAAFLFLGFSNLSAPFKQGILVPSPDVILNFATDASGNAIIPFTWPTGLSSNTSLFWQFWITDATALAGFSASNGLKSTTP